MSRLDDRIQALLDEELPPAEAKALRAQLSGTAQGKALAGLESAIAEEARSAPALPPGFERSVMSRVAARPAPRRSLWSWLTAPRFLGDFSLAGALAGAAAVCLLAAGASFAGYRLGRAQGAQEALASAATPAAPAPALASPAEEKVLVRFALKAPEARRVEVVGTFNGWGAKGVELKSAAGGAWTASLELPRGRYEYTFVVDGERWVPDPSAGELVDDGFGGHNAVLEL